MTTTINPAHKNKMLNRKSMAKKYNNLKYNRRYLCVMYQNYVYFLIIIKICHVLINLVVFLYTVVRCCVSLQQNDIRYLCISMRSCLLFVYTESETNSSLHKYNIWQQFVDNKYYDDEKRIINNFWVLCLFALMFIELWHINNK